MKLHEALESLDAQGGDILRSLHAKGEWGIIIRTHGPALRVVCTNRNRQEQAEMLRLAAESLENWDDA